MCLSLSGFSSSPCSSLLPHLLPVPRMEPSRMGLIITVNEIFNIRKNTSCLKLCKNHQLVTGKSNLSFYVINYPTCRKDGDFWVGGQKGLM